MGELVTVQARLVEVAARREDPEVVAVSEEIERLTTALRENSISIRMLPIRGTFERFRRLVHDLARDLHKEVELTIEGADTELDKSVIDQLNDPLMHLIRNSMDHGIEPPEARLAAKKRSGATIHLSARHSGASVLISVADDGGGIDAAAVRERAIEKGLVAADAQLTEAEIFDLILAPGFSTARQVTDVSGRGVGMDVVRRKRGGAARNHRDRQQAGQRNQRHPAPAPDPGHHRRSAGAGRAGLFCAAAGVHAGMHRADAAGHRAGQRQACGQRARGDHPYIRLREYFNICR